MPAKKEKRDSRNIQKRALSDLFTSEMENVSEVEQKITEESVAKENDNQQKEGNGSVAQPDVQSKLQLVPGETLIGTKTGKIGGEFRELDIYYGNYVLPLIRNNFLVLKKDEYLRMLNGFLDSEEGKIYERPSEEQIEQSFVDAQQLQKKYLKNLLMQKASETTQPGRSFQISEENEASGFPSSSEGGQSDETFADDPTNEDKAVEFIQSQKFSKEQILAMRKDIKKGNRRSTLATVLIAFISVAILGFAIFLIKDLIVRAHALIELELKQNSITIRAGDAFNPSDYVKYVTEDESVYIIYPSLDTEDVGEHSIDFVATNGIKNVRKTMTVNVIDGDSPTIVLTDEEIKLVRNRDEETFDALKYVKEVHDNIDPDEDLYVEVNDLDWEKEEQSLSYRVKDSSGNAGKAVLLVKIEDKAVCDKNATYNSASNTCSCKSGYSGDGIACKLIQSSSGGTAASGSGNSSGSGSSGSSGSSGGSSSSSSSSSSESYTIDYEDYQPGNGQYNVTITDNNTGDSTTVTTQDPPMPGASDDEFFDWINDQLP